MATKTCSKCKQEKPMDEFSHQAGGANGFASICKKCQAIYAKKWYQVNKAHVCQYQREWNSANPLKQKQYDKKRYAKKMRVINELRDVPCADCGKRYPTCVMDFHHPDGHIVGEKSIAQRVRSEGNLQQTIKDAKKCIVLCAKCHRLRHLRLRQGYKNV